MISPIKPIRGFLPAVWLLATVAVGLCCVGCDQVSSTASQSVAVPSKLPVPPGTPVKLASATEDLGTGFNELRPSSPDDPPPPPLDLPADPSAMVDVTFDHIKFDIEPDAPFEEAMLTPTINKLFERNIRIRGYIYPTLKKNGIKQFILVRDNQECCFGPGAALYDCILVHMKEGKTATYSIRPVAVEGDFSFEIFPDYDGTTRAIYRLDGDSVE
ncbi:MAG: DUF3299 domain-containing protein [Planctomycetota bacterium]